MKPGRYILIDGVAGTGKTAIIPRLVNRLRHMGYPADQVSEQNSDPAGKTIFRLAYDPMYNLTSRAEVLLFNAARAQAIQRIREMMARGIWCVADRGFISTLVFQGHARQAGSIADIETICQYALEGLQPDLTILLDIPAAVSMAHRKSRMSQNRFDKMTEEFYQEIRTGFQREAHRLNIPSIDALVGPEKVEAEIWKHINSLITAEAEKAITPV